MPQITVTLSDDVYEAVSQFPKGDKSKFVNKCVRDIWVNTCWKRLRIAEMFLKGYTGYIQAEKAKILTQEEVDILEGEAEASGENSYD